MKARKTKEALWLTTGELARLLERPVRTVKRWVAEAYEEGEFGVVRTSGGHYRIPAEVARSLSERTYFASGEGFL